MKSFEDGSGFSDQELIDIGVADKQRSRKKSRNRRWKGEQEERVGRNDKCPCGSGRRYKKCCM